ncbi:tRNA (adenosine(37)-N6)-threonylcarbamoyltransferase complex dimerization subunit type 1 TsaB [Desulfoplanes sp.]
MDTQPIVVINGTEELLQIVIGNGSGILFNTGIKGPGRTMKYLLPLLDEGLSRLGLSVRETGGIACTRGPGSFTGIRVVLATAAGLSRAGRIPLCGLDYLPILAGDIMAHWNGEGWVLTYARKNQVYMQGFAMPGGQPLGPARVCHHDVAAGFLASRGRHVLVCGSGLAKNIAFFRPNLPNTFTLVTHRCAPSPEALLGAALKGTYTNVPIAAKYLRASDAEDNLATIARKRGISLDEALKRIPS